MRKQDQARHTREQAEALFVEVLEQLNGYGVEFEPISEVLEKFCNFFGFGCAFIYERDHAKTYLLRERYVGFEAATLPKSFKLEDRFTPDEIAKLVDGSTLLFVSERENLSTIRKKFAELFCANTLFIVPITASGNPEVIGCVGIMDRRGGLLMDAHDIQLAHTLFSVVGNRIKLRIFQQRLAFTQATLTGIMDNTGIDIYANDYDTHEILYVNKSMAAPYGGIENMLGKTCYEALYNDRTTECEFCPKRKLIDEHGNPTEPYMWDYQRPFDGSWFRVLNSAFRWVDGRLAHVVSSVDITEGKKYELLVERMAFMDTLTGIPNRRMLENDFKAYLKDEHRSKTATMLFLDLDNFKRVNDTLGHAAGDELLIQFSQRLTKRLEGIGRAYRHGGDEFIGFIEGHEDAVPGAVEAILKDCAEGFELLGQKYICTISIGVVRYPEHGQDFNALLEASDHTMYRAKQGGKATAVFL